jgi:hypothetical protein
MEDVAMSPLLSLLALALVGAEAPDGTDDSKITYETWVVEMDGLCWRETMGHDLQLVSRQGGATVWTAPEVVVKPLLDRMAETSKDRLVRVPRVTASSQSVATIATNERRKVATKLTRHADGPVDHASAVAYTPEFEEVRTGFRVTMAGRKLDQGVLTKLDAEETRVAAIHKVKVCETVSGKGHPDAAGPCTLNATVEVPELIQGSVSGEWLIPAEGVLIISLGAHTTAGPEGKAEVHERLMIVQAWPAAPTDSTVARASLTPNFIFKLPSRETAVAAPEAIPMPDAPAAMPTPAMPSRSLPQPLDADGSPIPLPPLPELPQPPSSLPGTSDPCASPQMSVHKKDQLKEEPKRDPHSNPTGYFQAETARCAAGELLEPSEAKIWRIPIGGGILVEISVRGIFRNIGIACPDEAPAPK